MDKKAEERTKQTVVVVDANKMLQTKQEEEFAR